VILGTKKRKRDLDWDNDEDRELLLQIDAKKQLREAQEEEV
jgi:hypothetical protein